MLTTSQVRSFHDNGYLILRGVVAQRDLSALRRAADALQDDALRKLERPDYLRDANHLNDDWIEHQRDHYVYRRKNDASYGFHRVERLFPRDPVFAEFAMSPKLLAIAWSILERPFWPRAGNMVVKLPHEGAPVRWHQDIPYLYWSSGGHPSKGRPATHPIPNFTTDIYLEASNESNGCLYAIPGSHLSGTVDVDKLVPKPDANPPGAQPLELEPGDLMLHHVAVVHGSPENRSAALRRTFYVHYLTDETVADAYSDWPDLMTPQESRTFWSAAQTRRSSADGQEAGSLPRFAVTPQGLAPADAASR